MKIKMNSCDQSLTYKTCLRQQEDVEYAKKKRARLIVRNLSFKATEASLKQHFEQCGHVEVSQ